MTRMGDILQSTPLLRALKVKHPGAEIVYFAVSGFTEICRHIPEIDRLIPFDFNSAIAVSKEAIRYLPRRLQEIERFVEALKKENFDIVYNLSHSNISALMAHLIEVPETRGLTLNREGYRQISHPWARYFFTANLNRHYNRINLVDINLGLSLDIAEFAREDSVSTYPFGKYHLSFKVPEEAKTKANDLLGAWKGKDAPIVIGLQPGASLPCKIWPADSFRRTAQLLHRQTGAVFLVFGSADEAELAALVSGPLGDIALNLAGKTDVSTLGALLARTDLLITNDTGTQHLAAAVETPVISLCFGSALSHETGPYGEGHFVVEADLPCYPCSFHVECEDYRCQRVVTPEAVAHMARSLLSGSSELRVEDQNRDIFSGIIVWKTGFDAKGFWLLKPALPKPLRSTDAVSLWSRLLWQKVLTAADDDHALEGELKADEMEPIPAHYTPPRGKTLANDLEETISSLQSLQSLAESGAAHCVDRQKIAGIPETNIERMRYVGESLQEIDREINLLGLRLPAVNHLVLDFNFLKQNLEDNDLAVLAAKTGDLYRRLAALSSQLRRALSRLGKRLPTRAKAGRPRKKEKQSAEFPLQEGITPAVNRCEVI